MLPVVAGTPIKRPLISARIVYMLCFIGIALLCYGLTCSLPLILEIAMITLGIALPLFAVIVIITLRHALPQNMTARAIRLSILMLVATVLLGLTLLSNYVFGWWLQEREIWVNLHLTWGLLGWVGLLIVGVAYQVVPMFQLTPHYPPQLSRWLTRLLFILLLGFALTRNLPILQLGLETLLALGFATFALTTLWLQSKRRRKLPDVTLDFWRGGMLSLLLAIGLWLTAQIIPTISDTNYYGPLLGILMIVGFAMSVINGMLYKIVPFLVWFHLQSKRGAGAIHGNHASSEDKTRPNHISHIYVPNVREILAEPSTRRQMWLHFTALSMLIASVLLPANFTYLAALFFGASNLWLWVNLILASRIYYKVNRLIMEVKTS